MSYLFRFTPKLFSVCIAAIGFCSNAWADYSPLAETVPAENSNIQGSSGQFAAVSSYTMYVPSDYYSSSPSKKYPAIMVLAGAGDTLGPSDPTLSAFTTEGFIVYNLTHSSQYQAALTDIKDTIAYIRANNSRIDPSKIGVFGFSRGGFLSFLTSLDSTNGIRCAGGVAPPTNLSPYLNYKTYLPDFKAPGHEYTRWEEIAGIAQELFGVPLDPAVPGLSNTLYNASPINKINSGLNNQFYIVHGTGDTLVPFSSPTIPQSVPFTNLVNQRKGTQGGAWCDSYTGDHETPFPTGTGNQIANFFKQCTGHANYNGGPSAKPGGLSQCSGTAAKPLCSISATSTGVGKDGGTIYLTATCIDKSIYAGYSWLQNGTQISSTTSSQTSYTIPANTSTSPIDRVISVTTYNDLGTSNPASIVISQPGASSSGGTIPSCTLSASPNSLPYTGGNVTLTASCTGNPTSYNWTGGYVTSSNSRTYYVGTNNQSWLTSHSYSVTASNSAGTGSPAQVYVTQEASQTTTYPSCTISATPTSISYTGGNVSLSANCTGSPVEYYWFVDTFQQATTTTSSWASTLPVNNSSSPSTVTYGVAVKNSAGYISSPAMVTVTQEAFSTATYPNCTISATPTSIPNTGGNVSLSVNCTGSPVEYYWFVDTFQQATTTTPSWTSTLPANNSSSPSTVTYGVAAKNSAGYISSPAMVTVTQEGPPVVNTLPVCTISVTPASIPYAGGAANLTANCTNAPYEYQWFWNNTLYRTTSVPSLADNFAQNPHSYSYTGDYSVVARNSAGSSTPVSFTVTQEGPPAANTLPVCTIGVTPASIPYAGGAANLTVTCTNAPYEYQWFWNNTLYRTTSVPSLADNFAQNPYSYSYTGDYSVVARNSAGSSAPVSFTVTQEGPPAASTLPVCTISVTPASIPYAGGAANLTANCTNAPYEYQWFWNNTLYRTTSVPSLADNFAQNPYSYSYTGDYSVVARNSVGSSAPVSFTVTQEGPPVVNTVPVCTISATPTFLPSTGGAIQLSATCTGNPWSYIWMVNGARQGTTQTPNWVVGAPTNYSPNIITLNYTVTATNNEGSSQPSQAVAITIDSVKPVITISINGNEITGGSGSVNVNWPNTVSYSSTYATRCSAQTVNAGRVIYGWSPYDPTQSLSHSFNTKNSGIIQRGSNEMTVTCDGPGGSSTATAYITGM